MSCGETPALSMQRGGRLVAEVAGGLVRQGVAAFEDAGALDDPVGIEAEALVQVIVGDDGVGHVAAGAEHAHPHQTTTARSREGDAFFAHENRTACYEGPASDRAESGAATAPTCAGAYLCRTIPHAAAFG